MRNCQVCRQVSECILMDGNVHNLAHRSVLLPGRSRSNFESFHLIVFLANRWNSTNFETVFNRRFSGNADLLVGKGRKVATFIDTEARPVPFGLCRYSWNIVDFVSENRRVPPVTCPNIAKSLDRSTAFHGYFRNGTINFLLEIRSDSAGIGEAQGSLARNTTGVRDSFAWQFGETYRLD